MDKKRTNLCRIVMRVQKSIFASCPVIAAVERLALAPAAATDDHQSGLRVHSFGTMRCASLSLRHEIRSVGDKLAIDAKNRFERTFDLRLRVVLSLQFAHGRFDQFTQNGHIFGNSKPEVNPGLTHHSKAKLCGILSWSVAERRASTGIMRFSVRIPSRTQSGQQGSEFRPVLFTERREFQP